MSDIYGRSYTMQLIDIIISVEFAHRWGFLKIVKKKIVDIPENIPYLCNCILVHSERITIKVNESDFQMRGGLLF